MSFECDQFMQSFMPGHERTKNTPLPAFHNASNEVYEAVMSAFEHVHKNQIDWVTTDQIEVIDMNKALLLQRSNCISCWKK